MVTVPSHSPGAVKTFLQRSDDNKLHSQASTVGFMGAAPASLRENRQPFGSPRNILPQKSPSGRPPNVAGLCRDGAGPLKAFKSG